MGSQRHIRGTENNKKEMTRGHFVTIEGIEGSGKSTQAGRLIRRLRNVGHEVVAAREPGGTRLGEAIRDMIKHCGGGEVVHPETEVCLFSASRAQLVRGVIRPALDRGAWVVCDRFFDSTIAYQGYGRGLNIRRMSDIITFASNGAIPDITILLDMNVELGFERLGKRNGPDAMDDRFEREDRAFHEKVRNGYLELAKKNAERFRIVDGSRAADAIEAEIWNLIAGIAE